MIWIVLMGSLGCVSRWGIEEVVERRVFSHRPYATMIVNALGALIAGVVVMASYHLIDGAMVGGYRPIVGAIGSNGVTTWSPYLLTGFCGGFTTFSSALAIPYLDWRRGRRARAAMLIAGTPLLCIAGYWIGELIARIFVG